MRSLIRQLKRDVESIALPKGRRVGSPGHVVAEAYLEGRLREIGCVPYRGDSIRLPYTVGKTDFVNLVGIIPASKRTRNRPLLVGAHYDSVIDAPCADDNAAAVAVALAVGQMAAVRGGFDRDIVVATFDAEEPPYFQNKAMGSTRFYEDQMDDRSVHAAIIMDLVGHDLSLPVGMILSRGKMAAITALVLSLLGDLDGIELRRTGSEQFHDTFEVERGCFRSGFGPSCGFVVRRFGLKEIRSREDMDTVVHGLTGLGL